MFYLYLFTTYDKLSKSSLLGTNRDVSVPLLCWEIEELKENSRLGPDNNILSNNLSSVESEDRTGPEVVTGQGANRYASQTTYCRLVLLLNVII